MAIPGYKKTAQKTPRKSFLFFSNFFKKTLAFFEAECYTNEADGDQQEKISKSMRGSAWESAAFGTQRSQVQILSHRLIKRESFFRMVLFLLSNVKSMSFHPLPALTHVRAQRVLRANGTRLAPTEPEARPQVQILSHRLLGRGAGNSDEFPVLFLQIFFHSFCILFFLLQLFFCKALHVRIFATVIIQLLGKLSDSHVASLKYHFRQLGC